MSPFWTPSRHADRRPFLLARARIVAAVRGWFADQGFVEVEPNALVPSPGAETHIQAVSADGGYLHTSPEFAMKKLLAAGEEKIFYLGKVWRAGERGPMHAPEFTMLEWYRAGAPYTQVMDDCVALARVALNAARGRELTWRGISCDPWGGARKLAVRDAFRFMAGVELSDDPAAFATSGVRLDEGDTWSDRFSKVLVEKIEPGLGVGQPTLLIEYPAQEAALARKCAHDPRVAERFEMYACGVELANGFGELTDPVEQRARLEEAMAEKEKRYGSRWPIDEDFLAALAYMPPSSGVALGLDRLIALATGARSLEDVLWTPS